jgi:Xaa-Pro aminopeptidase
LLLDELGLSGTTLIGDHDGYPWIYGYTGPSLSKVTSSTFKRAYTFMDHQMSVKSAAEIGLIKESMKWANMAHVLLQRYTKPGISETEVSMRASMDATLAMKDALGSTFKAQAMGFFNEGALALYRGQIGKNSSLPHALTGNLEFAMGDVLVTGATAPVWGYLSEIERTMFVGEPSKEQVRMFGLMKEAQEVAFAAMRPDVKCADVDAAVNDFFSANNLQAYWRHHTGHGIGLRNHEAPYLDIGTDITLEPGMVFAVEPGLYHPELGGYRHADTVLITQTGAELLSYYPRDLESLIIPS